jgi:hypothetical protein
MHDPQPSLEILMALTTKNPYGPASGETFAMPPDTITRELSKAGSKHSARYPSGHITNQPGGEGGGTKGNQGAIKHRAVTGSGAGPSGA